MKSKLLTSSQQSGIQLNIAAHPLQFIASLSALAFVLNFTLEVLVSYEALFAHLVQLLCFIGILSAWALIECLLILRRQEWIPFQALTFLLIMQVAIPTLRLVLLILDSPAINPDWLPHIQSQDNWHYLFLAPYSLIFMGIHRSIVSLFTLNEKIHAENTEKQMLVTQNALALARDREERLSLAVRSTGVGIWDLNLQTRQMVWDESMFELYQMKREDFTNSIDAWEKSLHPDDRQRIEHEIEEAINNIKPFYTEFRIIRPNGEICHIESVAKVFFSDDGAPLRMLGSNFDITDRAIVDKMKTELMAIATHELRTPMTIILGYTELLKMDTGTKNDQQEMLEVIDTQSKAMIHLLNDMLDVARIESQAADLYQMEFQQIGPRLQTLAETFITPDNKNKVILEISPSLPEVKVDAAKIEQAVKNCLSNAYKFSPERGEVTMRVTEVTHNKQRKVLIAIEDQGFGMTPEQLKRVFEKFYRADPSGAIPGTGLGMAIIKSIIEQHGGSILIDSEYGKGTKVMLYLPVA